ncbi:hypothetical protein QVA66_10320 [Staphylococcus chromogenes]|nr:hypothetical protein [Staphylococcus chromogenes]
MRFELASNLACRILAGAGSMTLTNYQDEHPRTAEVLAHGLNEEGELIVVCEDAAWGMREVRVDVEKQAPEFHARIVAGTAHALGEIEWLEEGVGKLQLGPLFVHSGDGSLPFSTPEMLNRAQHLSEVDVDELTARELFGDVLHEQAPALIDAIAAGEIPGSHVLDPATCACPEHLGQVYVVDICEVGVVLMQTLALGTRVAFVPLEAPARGFEQLLAQFEQLSIDVAVWQVACRNR